MANMKIIKGARRELEYQLLAALFTPGCGDTAESLKRQLAPRGRGRIRAVGATPSPGEPSHAPESTANRTKT